jgi:hypothetical protein
MLPGLMAKYIQFIATKMGTILAPDTVTKIRDLQRNIPMSHDRLRSNFCLNAYGWEMFAEFTGLHDLTPKYYDACSKLVTFMSTTAQDEQASNIFIESIRDLLGSGEFYLEGTGRPGDKGYDYPPDRKDWAKRIGFRTATTVFLIGTEAMKYINESRMKLLGTRLEFSSNAIYEQLLSENKLIIQSGKTTASRKFNHVSFRVVKMHRGIIDDINDDEDAAQIARTASLPEMVGAEISFKRSEVDQPLFLQ